MRFSRISKNMLRVFAPITFVIGLAGCGIEMPTSPDRQGWEFATPQRGRTAVNPIDYMVAAGCTPGGSLHDSSTIAIKPSNSSPVLFNCLGASSDTVKAAAQAYLSAEAAASGEASVILYVISHQVRSCEPSGSQGHRGPDGYWVLGAGEYWIESTCWTRTMYSYVVEFEDPVINALSQPDWFSGSDGAGGNPGGSTDTTTTPTPTDTCANAVDSYGPLASRGVQDSLNVILAQSIGIDTEIPGVIYLLNGKYHAKRVAAIEAQTDNCYFAMGNYTLPYGATPVAFFHTHPYLDGTFVTCRLGGSGPIENLLNGGGSDLDWGHITTLPWYTIDPQHIFRLDPGVAVGNRSANSNIWLRNPTGCATKAS